MASYRSEIFEGNLKFNRSSFAAFLAALMIAGCGGGGSTEAPSQQAGTTTSSTPSATTPPATVSITPTPIPVPVPLSHLISLLKLRNAQPTTINIAGFGSSVGAGATLPDPTTQAPSMYFGVRFKATFNSTNIFNVTSDNRSLNGSILSQFIKDVPTGNWRSYLNEGKMPNLVLFSYGMNDGFPAIYNSAQPPPFFYTQLLAAIRLAQAAGADPIILTSPHPKSTVGWAMPVDLKQSYPTAVPAPVGAEQMTPPASLSVIYQDPLRNGILIPVSQRHLHINQLMRQAALEAGCAVIDVERYWFEAVSAQGEAALFNVGETVHPNLLGHQLSYQKAINEFLLSFAASM